MPSRMCVTLMPSGRSFQATFLEHGRSPDKPRISLKCLGVDITLTKDLEKFVAQKIRAGGYSDASEVIREALRELRAHDDPAERDSQELAELLLPAVRGSHRPFSATDFEQLRRR